MDCRRVQAAISERMDGEHLSHRVSDAVDRHLPGCTDCSTFESNAWRRPFARSAALRPPRRPNASASVMALPESRFAPSCA